MFLKAFYYHLTGAVAISVLQECFFLNLKNLTLVKIEDNMLDQFTRKKSAEKETPQNLSEKNKFSWYK